MTDTVKTESSAADTSSVPGSPKLHLRYLWIKSLCGLHILVSVSHWGGLSWGGPVTLGEGASLDMEKTVIIEPVVSTVNNFNSHSMSISILEGEIWNSLIPPTRGINRALLLFP